MHDFIENHQKNEIISLIVSTKINNILRPNQIQQLEEVIEKFDKDYKQGNMSRLSSDFKSALEEYGDVLSKICRTFNRESTIVQDFLKKMEDNGELQAMEKLETEWKEYKTALGKEYDQSENNLRMAIFESNELVTERINREYEEGLVSYTTALNDLADLTNKEFMMRNGLRLPNDTDSYGRRKTRQANERFYHYNPNQKLPRSIDWRKKGAVTPIKNQDQCGSCYAFAAVGALESYSKQKTGKLVDLSPQNVVDCTRQYGNFGCHGGFMVFQYAKENGIALESRYPYVAHEQNCKWQRAIASVKTENFAEIEPGDELALKHAVAKHGPVVVGISGSSRGFRFYKSGVFDGKRCGEINHAVLVVGYGRHRIHGDYWIVKNSWGPDWGKGGYIYMARNKGNMCHIASMASLPLDKN
uniref:Cathepsin L-like n=1 Tax=Elaeophora elaphi TaxID=1147741 RepID=A0A0R3RH97_9BILA